MSDGAAPGEAELAAARLPGACDCHIHVFGPVSRYPYAPGRRYTPPEATAAAYMALRRRLGLERVVVVQPSVYGTDNRRHCDALDEIPASRGVAVLSGDEPDAEIERLHRAGFRGIRLNLRQGRQHEPIGATLSRLGARLGGFGWHVQINAATDTLADAEADLARAPVPLMFDHYGGLSPWAGVLQPGLESVLRLLATGNCWIKLSAPYIHRHAGPGHRREASALAGARALVAAMSAAAPDRLVWGSNWPHPGFVSPTTADAAPLAPLREIDDGAMLRLFHRIVGDEATARRILCDNAADFYGFD